MVDFGFIKTVIVFFNTALLDNDTKDFFFGWKNNLCQLFCQENRINATL